MFSQRQTGTPAPKRTPVCRRDPANRPRCLQKQESAETGTPVGNAPSRDAVAINCAATGRGTRLRGCPAEVSAQADTVNCSRRIYSDGETAAILLVLGVTGQVAPLVSASAPRREVRTGSHLDCLRRSTRIAYNLRVLSKVLKAGRASCQRGTGIILKIYPLPLGRGSPPHGGGVRPTRQWLAPKRRRGEAA